MSKAAKVYCVSEAVSPITHMSGTSGNEAIVARQPVTTPKGKRWVPYLSGNMLRKRLVRDGFAWLIRHYELEGKLNQDQLTFLMNGGGNTSSGQFEDTKRVVTWSEICPLGGLLGGCMADQIVDGGLETWQGRLVCHENQHFLACDIPSGVEMPTQRLRSLEDFLGSYQYTRAADRTFKAADYDEITDREEQARETGKKEKSDRMIFGGQCVNVGAVFLHGFIVKHGNPLDLGALLWSLQLWQESGGTVGGQSSRGHGRLKTSVYLDGYDQTELVANYLEHVDANKDAVCEWLEREFTKARKTVKKK